MHATYAQQEKIDMNVINKIRKEGLTNSQVMDIAFNVTDANGPRVTNSYGFKRAADFAIRQMTSWGLKNARLDPWGEFG
jgi:hypothetical protein